MHEYVANIEAICTVVMSLYSFVCSISDHSRELQSFQVDEQHFEVSLNHAHNVVCSKLQH